MTHRSDRLFPAVAVLAALAVMAIARANLLTFPRPEIDEARFYLPALWWAQHGGLEPRTVNAPNGIFWVPDGFTVLIGLALRSFGGSIATARLVCEVATASAVFLFALALRRFTGSARLAALCTLPLVSPATVYAASMVRMEAILLLLVAAALVLDTRGHRLGAFATLLATVLFHPAALLAALGYLGAVLIVDLATGRPRSPPAAPEWIVLGLIMVLIGAEVWRIVGHLELFRAHMAYQSARKFGRSPGDILVSTRGVACMLVFAVSAVALALQARRRRDLVPTSLPVIAVALGLSGYAAFGGEAAYAVYAFVVAPVLALATLFRTGVAPDRDAASLVRGRAATG